MDFRNAIKAIYEGKKVSLPEWEGYWFEDKGYINVLTKDGYLLTTPWFSKYCDRVDWEIISESKAHEAEMKYSFDTLDRIDILKLIMDNSIHTFGEFVEALENTYDNSYITDNRILDGCILNHISQEELLAYMKKKYHDELKFETVETIKIELR